MSKKYTNLEDRIRQAAPPAPNLPKSLRTQVLTTANTQAEQELRQRRFQAIGIALLLWVGLSGLFFVAMPRPSDNPGPSRTQEQTPDASNEWKWVEYTRSVQKEYLRILKSAF